MPPKPKTPEEIFNERELILKNALVLLVEKGYLGLTMRDIAKLCNFSPTKIYYYFANKDDIVMNLMKKGYILLNELTTNALEKESTLKGKSECVCRELFNFGLQYEEYFKLMFALGTPHVTDFIEDEKLEIKAYEYKKVAFDYYDLFSQNLKNYADFNKVYLNELQILSIFSHIVGILKLYAAKIMRELCANVNDLFEVALSGIIKNLET